MDLNIAVVDDLAMDCERIEKCMEQYFLDRHKTANVVRYYNAEDFLKAYRKGEYQIMQNACGTVIRIFVLFLCPLQEILCLKLFLLLPKAISASRLNMPPLPRSWTERSTNCSQKKSILRYG